MSASTIGASGAIPKGQVGRRLRNVGVALPVIGGVLGSVHTQTIAYKLRYHPGLGSRVFSHVYWPWGGLLWSHEPWAAAAPLAFHAGLMATVGAACFGLGFMALIGSRKKPIRHEDVHGTARFATEAEVRSSGLLPEDKSAPNLGLYVGAWETRRGLEYLRHEGSQHIIGVAPMRTGKTHSLVIPNLLSWLASAIIYDPKGEIWDLTSGWRSKEARNNTLYWDLAAIRGTVAYNFVEDCVRLGTDHEYADMANLIEAVVDPTGKGLEGHFDPAAADALTGIALHICYEHRLRGTTASLSDILDALQDPDRNTDRLFQTMIANTHLSGQRHEIVASTGAKMMGKDNRERSGIISTCQRMLRQLNDPILARNTKRCDFRIDDLMDSTRPVSLYIVLKDEDRLRLRPLVRLFMTRMMDRLCSAAMRSGERPHKHNLLLMMDEFPSLGQMDAFVSSLARCPGYGIRAFLLVQDREQVVLEYTKDETVSAKCHIGVAFAPNSHATAEWLADLIGKATVSTEDVSESGAGGVGRLTTSRSFHSVSRNLLNPDEIRRLRPPVRERSNPDKVVGPGQSLVWMSGEFPILAKQSLYFLDPEFVRRTQLLPADQITGRAA